MAGMNLSRSNKKNKVLLFRNIMVSPEGKEGEGCISCGSHYLASSLKSFKIPFIFSDSRISLNLQEFITERKELRRILDRHRDINFIIITVSEFYYFQIEKLIKFLKIKTDAFICIGGIMPTLAPDQVFANLSEANILVRGVGEGLLPKIVGILSGKSRKDRLSDKERKEISALKGVFFRNKFSVLKSRVNSINNVKDYDKSCLDFSFIEKKDLADGLALFSSWGCSNRCLFCTNPFKGSFIAKSSQNLKEILEHYYCRLKALYGEKIPESALRVFFYDDDFLGDSERAVEFFKYLKNSVFKINFFQTGINSFFRKNKKNGLKVLNKKLINALCPDIFDLSKDVNVYIGAENFSDKELRYLLKGYRFQAVEEVVRALARRKIKAAYHFIASNQETNPNDLVENLFKIAQLQVKYREYFQILVPIIPYLISLYPSASYKKIANSGKKRFLKINRVLQIKNDSSNSYPLVENDIPRNLSVRILIPLVDKLFQRQGNYRLILDEILFKLLLLGQKRQFLNKEIKKSIKKYRNYPNLISKEAKIKSLNNRSSLQLMLTRRCQLRCKYCPVVKKNLDMDERVLKQAINLLFTSNQENLRLDFTGGEPLLRFDLLEKAVEYSKALAKKKNKRISFYMVTNLIALTDEIADFLAEEKFFLELSLDGEEKFHNLYKLGKLKVSNPYHETVSQLHKIFSRRINNYAVMVAGAATANNLFHNFEHLLKLGFRNLGINYALCSIWTDKKRKNFFRQLDLIWKKYNPYFKKGLVNLSNLGSRDEPAIINSEIMINGDGKVHFLTDWLFERGKQKKVPALGSVEDIKDINNVSMTPFMILDRLLAYHTHEQRKIIINNIEMGNMAGKYFELWKKRLKK